MFSVTESCRDFTEPEVRLSDGASFTDSIRARGELKEEALAYSRAATLTARQPLNKMPRLKPLLKKREDWMRRQMN